MSMMPPMGGSNAQTEQVQAIIQAVAQGQDISQFSPEAISAAKRFTAMRANELNTMINSTNIPQNVSREMLRNELQMYEGFTSKLAEDDPEFASMMDVALIGAGVYATAKYGPLALAKAKTMGEAAYSNAQSMSQAASQRMSDMSARAKQSAARGFGFASRMGERGVGAARDMGQRGMGAAKGYAQAAGAAASPYVQRTGQAINRGIGGAAAGMSSAAEYLGSPEFQSSTANLRNRAQNVGQKTYGFGKNLASGLSKGVRRLFRMPF